MMKLKEIYSKACDAKQLSGKNITAQIFEILTLRKQQGKIGPSEYFDYNLYDDCRFDNEAKKKFVGWASEIPINNSFNKSSWDVLSLDKIIFYTLLKGAGIPYPNIKAIYSITGRRIESVPTLRTVASLADYLKMDMTYPVFVKPSHGNFGRGAYFLTDYDASSESIILANDQKTGVNDFVTDLETKLSHGQIFQEIFEPPPELVPMCGRRSLTVRVVVAIGKQGPTIVGSAWKIPTGSNIIDNFKHGRTGNLVASVDMATGNVKRVIGGGKNGSYIEHKYHPETEVEFSKFTVPYWERIKELCYETSRILPGYRLCHFDVALSEKGPLILEVNVRGNFDLIQHASGQGFFSEKMQEANKCLEEHQCEIDEAIQRTQMQEKGNAGA